MFWDSWVAFEFWNSRLSAVVFSSRNFHWRQMWVQNPRWQFKNTKNIGDKSWLTKAWSDDTEVSKAFALRQSKKQKSTMGFSNNLLNNVFSFTLICHRVCRRCSLARRVPRWTAWCGGWPWSWLTRITHSVESRLSLTSGLSSARSYAFAGREQSPSLGEYSLTSVLWVYLRELLG